MHERERWQKIVALAQSSPVVRVRDLTQVLETSPATLRRDLVKLEEQGLLRRVHGGAEAVVAHRKPLSANGNDAGKKRAIGRLAASLCQDGDSIIINAGSTTWYMVEFIRQRHMHILTNSVPISHELISTSENRVVLPGGEVHRQQGVILSPFDDDSLQHFTASLMFMSCVALTAMGVIEGDPLIARAEAKLLTRAEKLVVLADSSKFSQRGSMAVCPLSRVDTLITDSGAPDHMLDVLRSVGVNVVIADA